MLSTSAHAVKIALDGYDTWSKDAIVPSEGMIIQPILHKTGTPVEDSTTVVSDTTTVTGTAAPAAPQPKRADVDPIAAPPTPDTLVVPGDK
jgi:hypothetical protein